MRDEAIAGVLRVGRGITVTTTSGDVVRGKVELYDGERLRVDGTTWSLRDGEVANIRARVSDSLLNGTLIGALARDTKVFRLDQRGAGRRVDIGPLLTRDRKGFQVTFRF